MQNKNDKEERLPIEYFKNFISNELLHKICEQSNIYALQKNVKNREDLNSDWDCNAYVCHEDIRY